MDTLPHNGAIITLLAITGLTHRQSYGDIFAITCIKTSGGVRRHRGVLPHGDRLEFEGSRVLGF